MSAKGFTIVETLVAYAALMVLMLGALQIMDVEWKTFQTGGVSASLRMQIVTAFTRMERELQSTRPSQVNLASGATSTALTFKIPQDIDGDGTVLDAMGSVEWSADITYALNNANQLTRTTGGATAVFGNDITALQFTRPVAPLNVLQIALTARRTTTSGRLIQDTDQITLKMRN